MTTKRPGPSSNGFRCLACGEVIGVYEPLVVGRDSHARATSRAAEPSLDAAGTYYHRRCFAALDDKRPDGGGSAG